MDWMQILGGAASAVVVLGALFTLANNYIVSKIETGIGKQLKDFETSLIKTLKEGYVSRAEYVLMEEHAKEIHGRHDKEIDQLWSAVNRRTHGQGQS